MTVCIAALCENGTIFGASDRMMTAGDIEFEPDLDSVHKPSLPAPLGMAFNANTKIYAVTTSVVIMTAGDAGLQAEIVQDVIISANRRIQKDNTHWISVKEITDMYLAAYNGAKSKRAQQTVFAPLGLDAATFLERSGAIAPHIVLKLTERIQRFDSFFRDVHGVETIIVGIDTSMDVVSENLASAHLYSVIKAGNEDSVTCCDSLGFAAVGSGARHASSQFMLAGHSPFASSPETLLLTYLAKKRSEVAPGVGKGTDMFTMGPGLGSFAMLQNIEDFSMKTIEAIYVTVDEGQRRAFQDGMAATKDYIARMFKQRADKQAVTPPASGQNPTN